MEITVVKEFTFDAAHYLPNHPGKCKNTHGHTYRLQVGYKGDINPDTGMVIDFSDIKKLVKEEIVDKLDHQFLNQLSSTDGFPSHLSTAENMVIWIVNKLIYTPGKLCFVRLYETPTSYAEWRAE